MDLWNDQTSAHFPPKPESASRAETREADSQLPLSINLRSLRDSVPDGLVHHFDDIVVIRRSALPFVCGESDLPYNYLAINNALETNDTSKLNAEQMNSYESIAKFKNGDSEYRRMDKIFGVGDSLSITDRYVNEKLMLSDEFFGAPTETMVKRGSALNDLVNETFTKIIMGDPIDTFDKFVEDWNKLGGTDMTNEVNAWYEQNK